MFQGYKKANICVIILLLSSMNLPKLPMVDYERIWQQRNLVRMANWDCLSIWSLVSLLFCFDKLLSVSCMRNPTGHMTQVCMRYRSSSTSSNWLPCLALLGQRWDWSARCQYTVTEWGRKFDLQLLSVWQHIKLSEQIRPWDTLACYWDVKQRTTNKLLQFFKTRCVILHIYIYPTSTGRVLTPLKLINIIICFLWVWSTFSWPCSRLRLSSSWHDQPSLPFFFN